jgi:hypothetical protein
MLEIDPVIIIPNAQVRVVQHKYCIVSRKVHAMNCGSTQDFNRMFLICSLPMYFNIAL